MRRRNPPPQPPVSELQKNFFTKNVPKTGQNWTVDHFFEFFSPEALSKKVSIFLGKIEDLNPSDYSDFKAFFGNFWYINMDAKVHKLIFNLSSRRKIHNLLKNWPTYAWSFSWIVSQSPPTLVHGVYFYT